MYTYKLNKDGITVQLNKYGMKMIECICCTNHTEAYHKGLVQLFGSWPCGLEMSDCLLMEHRHRHNHRVSELRRLDFPILGHCNTWLVDLLQNLIWKNHGIQYLTGWTNAIDYDDTDESFDSILLCSQPLADALQMRWESIDESTVKLTQDQQYAADAVGAKLPFFPFIHDEEFAQFARCALDNEFLLDDDEFSV